MAGQANFSSKQPKRNVMVNMACSLSDCSKYADIKQIEVDTLTDGGQVHFTGIGKIF